MKTSTRRERYKRGIVFVITSDKVINSLMIGSVVGFINSINEGLSKYIQLQIEGLTGLFIPVKIVAAIGLSLVFVVAFYADRNTDEWRDKVREITDEDEAVDAAEEESEKEQ